jgi:hypothetical protein
LHPPLLITPPPPTPPRSAHNKKHTLKHTHVVHEELARTGSPGHILTQGNLSIQYQVQSDDEKRASLTPDSRMVLGESPMAVFWWVDSNTQFSSLTDPTHSAHTRTHTEQHTHSHTLAHTCRSTRLLYCCQDVCDSWASSIGQALGYAGYAEVVFGVLAIMTYMALYRKETLTLGMTLAGVMDKVG